MPHCRRATTRIRPGLNRTVLPRLPHLAFEPFVRVPITNKFLGLGIPLEFSAEAHRNDAQVTDRSGAGSNFGFANRLLAGANEIKEICRVTVALVQPAGSGRGRSREYVRLTRLNITACDPNPPFAADELHAMALAFLIRDGAVPGVSGCGFA